MSRMLEALKLLEQRHAGLPATNGSLAEPPSRSRFDATGPRVAMASGCEPAPVVDEKLGYEQPGADNCLLENDSVRENRSLGEKRAIRLVSAHDFLEPFPDVLADDWACLGDARPVACAEEFAPLGFDQREAPPTLGLFSADYEVFKDDELFPAAKPDVSQGSCLLPAWRMPGEACRRLAERLPAGRDPALGRVLMFSALGGPLSGLLSLLELGVAFADARAVETVLLVSQPGSQWPAELCEASSGRGFADVLAGTASWSDVLRPSGHDRLWIVGPGEQNSRHTSPPPKGVWNPLRQRPMHVLVEGSLCLTPASAAGAAACDGVYLVLPLGGVRRRQAVAMARSLRQAGAELLGVIGIDGSQRISAV